MMMFAANRRTWMGVFIAAGCVMSGCVPATDAKQDAWSTKNESVVGPTNQNPELNERQQLPSATTTDVSQLRDPAISILVQAANSTNPLLRANAIEALQSAPDHLTDVVRRGLGDGNRGVRFVAAMTVGKMKLTHVALLLEPLLHDESQSVQAAAIYGIRRCGGKADLNPLAAMLNAGDAEVKGNAAFVLGELGERSAVRLLRSSIGRGLQRASPARRKIVELQIAAAMVKLGDTSQLDVIHAALFAPMEEGELVALACQMVGELKDGSRVPDLRNLIRWSGKQERPAEIRLAAAWAIAQIEPSRTPLEVPIAYAASDRYELRAQAAHVFSAAMADGTRAAGSGSELAVSYLAKLLSDPNPLVQVAATPGILSATGQP